MESGKHCSVCAILKPLDGYTFDGRAKDGRQSRCRECTREYHKSYYKKNKEAVKAKSTENYHNNRDTYLKRAYNITEEQYQAMVVVQCGTCAVCGEIPDKRLSIDHDHNCCPGASSCGKCIRGLLCQTCNLGGVKRLSPTKLRKLADYIEEAENARC